MSGDRAAATRHALAIAGPHARRASHRPSSATATRPSCWRWSRSTTIVGVGLNVLVGLAGQFSLGHVGFYAIGAYVGRHPHTEGRQLLARAAAAGVARRRRRRAAGGAGPARVRALSRHDDHRLRLHRRARHHRMARADRRPERPDGHSASPRSAGTLRGRARRCRDRDRCSPGSRSTSSTAWRASPWGKAMVAVRDSETAARAIGFNPVVVKTSPSRSRPLFTGLAGGLFAALFDFVAPGLLSVLPVDPVPARRDRRRRRLDARPRGRRRRHRRAARADLAVSPNTACCSFGALLLVVLWLAPEGVLGTLARRLGKPRRQDARPAPALSTFAAFLGAGASADRLRVEGLTIAFGGVRAATDVTLDRRARPRHRHHRPQRRRQDHRAQHDRRLLPPRRRQHPPGRPRARRRSGLARRRAPASPAPTRPRSCSARSACSTTC